MDIRKVLKYRIGFNQGVLSKRMGYASEDVNYYLVSKSVIGQGFRDGYLIGKRRKHPLIRGDN